MEKGSELEIFRTWVGWGNKANYFFLCVCENVSSGGNTDNKMKYLTAD